MDPNTIVADIAKDVAENDVDGVENFETEVLSKSAKKNKARKEKAKEKAKELDADAEAENDDVDDTDETEVEVPPVKLAISANGKVIICNFCKVAGHHKDDCDVLKNNECGACGKLGHTERHCKIVPYHAFCTYCENEKCKGNYYCYHGQVANGDIVAWDVPPYEMMKGRAVQTPLLVQTKTQTQNNERYPTPPKDSWKGKVYHPLTSKEKSMVDGTKIHAKKASVKTSLDAKAEAYSTKWIPHMEEKHGKFWPFLSDAYTHVPAPAIAKEHADKALIAEYHEHLKALHGKDWLSIIEGTNLDNNHLRMMRKELADDAMKTVAEKTERERAYLSDVKALLTTDDFKLLMAAKELELISPSVDDDDKSGEWTTQGSTRK
jgi:hypothetical protein